MKSLGLSARGTLTSPAPSSSTEASCVRAVSAQAAPAVDINADLISAGVQLGCRAISSAAAPATWGVAMLVPSKTANGSPNASGNVAERICPPGAARSGLSWCPKSVGPADEKLVMMPLRPVFSWLNALTKRTVARPPFESRYARRRAPSRSETMPASSGSCSGMKFASPGRLSARTMPAAPPIWAFAALVVNAQTPRETSRIVPRADSGGSVPRVLGLEAGPQRCRSTGLPSVPTIVPTSVSVWSALVHAAGIGRTSWNGMFFNVAGASLVVTLSGAETPVVTVVPGRDHRHDTRVGDIADGLDERVADRIDLRPAAGEVDHVHAVGHGRFERGHDLRREGVVPRRGRRVEDAVIAEPGPWRHAAQSGDRRMVRAGRGRRARIAGGDPGHVRPMERALPVERQLSLRARARAREGASDDHLRCREPGLTAGKAGWIAEPSRAEERVRLVDTVVDDADLDAVAAVTRRRPHLVGADDRRALVGVERVTDAGIDLGHGLQPRERR